MELNEKDINEMSMEEILLRSYARAMCSQIINKKISIASALENMSETKAIYDQIISE